VSLLSSSHNTFSRIAQHLRTVRYSCVHLCLLADLLPFSFTKTTRVAVPHYLDVQTKTARFAICYYLRPLSSNVFFLIQWSSESYHLLLESSFLIRILQNKVRATSDDISATLKSNPNMHNRTGLGCPEHRRKQRWVAYNTSTGFYCQIEGIL